MVCLLLTDKLILKAAEKIKLKEEMKAINVVNTVSYCELESNNNEGNFVTIERNDVIESVPLKDKITNTAKQVAQTVKNKVVHIWEVITKHKLKEFIVGKLIKKAMITQINHTTNTVTIKDMDNCNYYSIQGTDISENVCLGTLISV